MFFNTLSNSARMLLTRGHANAMTPLTPCHRTVVILAA